MKTMVMLDASALSHSACTYRIYREVVEGWRARYNSINIEFGQAFHKFRRIFREKKMEGFAEGIFAAKKYLAETVYFPAGKRKEFLTSPEYLVKVCTDYAFKYEDDNFEPVFIDKNPLLECKFTLPYHVDDDLEVLIAGTMDEIGKFKKGIYCICDCKTTGSYDVEEYLSSYLLSSQLLFYHWVIRQYATLPESPYSDICSGDIGLFIDGVFVKTKDTIEFQRSIVWIPPKHIVESYENMLHTKLSHLINAFRLAIKSGVPPSQDGIINNFCTGTWRCPFFTSCSSPDTFCRDTVLEQQFVRIPYDPLTFQ